MVQAARSGVQNIAEGSLASATSKETELKLTNVARASLGELLLDYEDFLRQRGLRLWGKDSPEALEVRRKYQSDRSDKSDRSDPYRISSASPEAAANTLVCLINQAGSLLRNQIRQLEEDFLAHGGIRERMTRARLEIRGTSPDQPDMSDWSDNITAPGCPKCGKPMRQRTARTGPNTGQTFWGCTGYPDCKGTRNVQK